MKLKFDQTLEVNGHKLTKAYIQSLSYQERVDLVEPIFHIFRNNGFPYPDKMDSFSKDFAKLVALELDQNNLELFNNSSLCTNICKFFCKNFYRATEIKSKTMIEVFNDDKLLKRIIFNRLGGEWLLADAKGAGVNEAFNFTPKQIIQGMRSTRSVPAISIFKPSVAKFMYSKYSQEGDTVYDYSAGWGGRLLGATSCSRKYIGTDPLTTDELQIMSDTLKLKNVQLIKSGSEHVRLNENSIDFSFSSPPYFDQEYYSSDSTQAYNNGEDYFYNTYWVNTLDNVKYMLKPDKWFGLNVKNYPRMLEMAEAVFGPVREKIGLRTIRSHLNKSAGIEKSEYIYMFKNNKSI